MGCIVIYLEASDDIIISSSRLGTPSPLCKRMCEADRKQVNNSGVIWGESIDTYPDSAFTKLLTLNVQRVFTLTQKLIPMLTKGAERGSPGRVINVSQDLHVLRSIRKSHDRDEPMRADRLNQWALRTRFRDIRILRLKSRTSPVRLPHSLSHLVMTFDRLISMSRHLASRLGPNITVNTLALGPFRSRMMKSTLDAAEKEIADALPIPRIGKPEDVVAACLYLSGKGGEWVTGYALQVLTGLFRR